MSKNEIKIIEIGPSMIASAALFIVLHESLVREIASIYGVPYEYLEPSNTACSGIAVGSDKPVLSGSDNSTVTEAGSPALR